MLQCAVFACWRRRPAGQRSCRLQPLQLHQSWSGGSSSSWSCRAGIKASSAPSKRPERDHHIFPQAPPPWPELVVQGHGTDQRATGQTPRSKRMEWDGSVAGHCSEITHRMEWDGSVAGSLHVDHPQQRLRQKIMWLCTQSDMLPIISFDHELV